MFWILKQDNNYQLLDEVEQNVVICQCREDQRQIIDLRATDESRSFARTEYNNCFIILLQRFL